MIDIDKLLELESKVDPETWKQVGADVMNQHHGSVARCVGWTLDNRLSNHAEYIVTMRNNIRPLLLELKAARKVVEATKEYFKNLNEIHECVPCECDGPTCENPCDGHWCILCDEKMQSRLNLEGGIEQSIKDLEGG